MVARWKYIYGTNDQYAVSTEGEVAAVKDGKLDHKLSPIFDGGEDNGPNKGKAYEYVDLVINGNRKHCYIHHLVAEAFLPNPKRLPDIEHKDHNRRNNSVDNLEWISVSGNNSHPY